MPRYIITKSQLHDAIYKYLNDEFKNPYIDRKVNPYVESGNTYRMYISKSKGKPVSLSYFYFEPGTYEDGETEHFGIGGLSVDGKLVDTIRKMFSVRESRVLDLIADWLSEKLEIDIDNVDIDSSSRKTPPVY